jgi:hypothetical protein
LCVRGRVLRSGSQRSVLASWAVDVMDRRVVHAFAFLFVIGGAGCAAKGRAHVRSASAAPQTARTEPVAPMPPAPETAQAPVAAGAAPTTPAAPSTPAQPTPGCALVCHVATKGRAAPADEARLTSSLAEETRVIRECVRGPAPSMTLRFDSTGTLTGFGVDQAPEESGEAASCIEAINLRRPAVSYPGPSTLRCVERCAAH